MKLQTFSTRRLPQIGLDFRLLPASLPVVLDAHPLLNLRGGLFPLFLQDIVHQPQPAENAFLVSDVGHAVGAEVRRGLVLAFQRAD